MTRGSLSAEARADIERWLRRRGVPQLIQGYRSEPQMDARAAPLIATWLVLGSILFWGRNPAWSTAGNIAAIVATLAVIGLGVMALRRTRRGRPTLGVDEVLLLAALPAVPAALIQGSPITLVATFFNALLGIGAVYVVVGFGLIEIAAWAVARVGAQAAEMITLVGRTLPLLLILVVFLLFAAEIWEAAHHISGAELIAVVGLLLLVAALLVVTTVRVEIRRLEETADWRPVLTNDERAPAAARMPDDAPIPSPPLRSLERTNLLALGLIGVLIQALTVALLMMAFLVIFGLIVVPAEVQAAWVGTSTTTLLRFELLGESRTLTTELVTVSALLSGIVGLYFTGLAVTDRSQRGEYLGRLLGEMRLLLAVRAWYLDGIDPHVAREAGARGDSDAPATATGFEPRQPPSESPTT